jgi:hypothetical protein
MWKIFVPGIGGVPIYLILIVMLVTGLATKRYPVHKIFGIAMVLIAASHGILKALYFRPFSPGFVVGGIVLSLAVINLLIGLRVIKAKFKIHKWIGVILFVLATLHAAGGLYNRFMP